MVTPKISAITRYIPELENKLTPAEINDFVNYGQLDPECFEDTDIIPKDYETTQAELTALTSGDFSSMKTTDIEEIITTATTATATTTTATTNGSAVENMNIQSGNVAVAVADSESTELVSDASEETVTAYPSDDEMLVLEPSTLEETARFLDQKYQAMQHSSSSSISSSCPNSPKPPSKTKLTAEEMKMLNNQFQHLARNSDPIVVIERSCSMQQNAASKTDSESSDNERVCIQQFV